MSPLSMAVIPSVATTGATPDAAFRLAQLDSQRVGAFDDAMARQSAGNAAQAGNAPVETKAAAGPDAPSTVPAPNAAGDAQERARHALELDPAGNGTKPSGGDAILNGLTKLRGAFDTSSARVAHILQGPVTSVTSLMAAQVELVKYTMLIDITGKLTGKSTQSLDTLMKGQ
jgi:type III secretion system YscI/HrpB-like protein